MAGVEADFAVGSTAPLVIHPHLLETGLSVVMQVAVRARKTQPPRPECRLGSRVGSEVGKKKECTMDFFVFLVWTESTLLPRI